MQKWIFKMNGLNRSALKKYFVFLLIAFFQVIDLGGEAVKASEYFGLGRVTEFKYSAKLGTVVRKWNDEKLSYLKYVVPTLKRIVWKIVAYYKLNAT